MRLNGIDPTVPKGDPLFGNDPMFAALQRHIAKQAGRN